MNHIGSIRSTVVLGKDLQDSRAQKFSRYICDVLRDLVPFVQFKKREKYPWRSVTFSEMEGF